MLCWWVATGQAYEQRIPPVRAVSVCRAPYDVVLRMEHFSTTAGQGLYSVMRYRLRPV